MFFPSQNITRVIKIKENEMDKFVANKKIQECVKNCIRKI